MGELRVYKLFALAALLSCSVLARAQTEAPADVTANESAVAAAESPPTDLRTDAAIESAIESATETTIELTREPPPGAAIVPGSELESMTGPLIRMVLSLAAVLALVGAFAWLAKRFRGGQLQGGLIQIVSGLSLGPKEKVVLLRVGDEEVLVGMSPAGMQRLHVMNKPSDRFSLDMANQNKRG